MNSITSIIGVTADLRRDFEGDYAAIKTCVFGIDKEEYEALVNKGFKVNPRYPCVSVCSPGVVVVFV